jgi:hypothetical protein
MKIVLELELDSIIQAPLSTSNPFAEELEIRWKVLSHDFTTPEDMGDANTVIHRIQPITLKKQYSNKQEWVTKC